MGHQHRPCDPRPKLPWTRMCSIASAIVVATAGCAVVLSAFSGKFNGHSSFRGRNQHPANTLLDSNAGVVGSVAADSDEPGSARTTRAMQELEMGQSSGSDTLGASLTKHYANFTEYALECATSKGLSSLPVPVVPVEGESSLSIPVITIIGVEKGGTTNLRGNLMTHPNLDGIYNEVHFFDMPPSRYPEVGQWEGDGLDQDMDIKAAGEILSKYALHCAKMGRQGDTVETQRFRTDRLHVDSAPRYIFDPLAPYRINMVRPGAKFVLVLRDPTERYFSQLRMEMCRYKPNHPTPTEVFFSYYHRPSGAKEYLAAADERYEPYTATCRGENASSSDLANCYDALWAKNPLYRGLYAEQLERWFRVFDLSQIMIVEANEMFADFTTVVGAVAEFAGLPQHRFVYDVEREHKSGVCAGQEDVEGNDYFVEGGRYDSMFEEAELLREWYRPHNERLYKLLGREPMWQ